MLVVRSLLVAGLIALLAACQSLPQLVQRPPVPEARLLKVDDVQLANRRTVIVKTIPAGGEVVIQPLGRQVLDGESIALDFGLYTLTASRSGYRSGNLQLRVDEAVLPIVSVPLGEGFASVHLISDPSAATVSVGKRRLGVTPLSVELGAQEHLLEVSLAGFETLSQPIHVVADQPQRVELVLQPGGNLATLEISTEPRAALIRLDGQLVGHSPMTLSNIPPGKHRLYAELIENSHSRLTGNMDLNLVANQHRQVNLSLDRQEVSFNARVAAAKAEATRPEGLALIPGVAQQAPLEVPVLTAPEVVRDNAGVAADPQLLSVQLDESLRLDLSQRQFVTDLLVLLRIGDGFDFYQQQLKVGGFRKQQPLLSPELLRQLSAMGVDVREDVRPLSADSLYRLRNLVFDLYGQRGGYPLLELQDDQSVEQTQQVRRVVGDGEIWVLGEYSAGFDVAGSSPLAVGAGIGLYRLEPGDGVINISWRQRPGRLLVTAANSPVFAALAAPNRLALREKLILNPLAGQSVNEVTELTAGPEFRGWRKHQLVKLDSDLAGGLEPLIEIGPHERAGNYRRAWIVRYRDQEGERQRQLSLAYQVGTQQEQVTSDEFLRRDGFSRFSQ